eukprot:jgi/Chlat1/1407/Chrsp12S02057
MVEHFNKWVEVTPFVNKESNTITEASINLVSKKFGGCADVLADRGNEFRGKYDDVLHDCFINCRPDGLIERIVRTVKGGPRKFCRSHDQSNWDIQLPRIMMGDSPYFSAIWPSPTAVSFYENAQWLLWNYKMKRVKKLTIRAKLFKRVMPVTMDDLVIAQHRRLCLPTLTNSEHTGHYYNMIFKVKEVRNNGVLLLEGCIARMCTQQMKNGALCHLLNIDGDPKQLFLMPATDAKLRTRRWTSKHAAV